MVSVENFIKVLFLTYDVVRTSRWGTTSITWPTICLPWGADPTTLSSSRSSSASVVATMDWSATPYPPTWTCRYLTHRRPSPHFCTVAADTTGQLSACTSPRMTWHVHSWCCARHYPLKFRTIVPLPKELSSAV